MSKLPRADMPKRSSKRQSVSTQRKRKISSCPNTPTLTRMNPTSQLLQEVSERLDNEYDTEAPKRLPKKEKKGTAAKKQQPKKERKGVSVWKFVTLDLAKDKSRKELKNKHVMNPFGDAFENPTRSRKISSSCPPSPVFALPRPTKQIVEEVSEKLLDKPAKESEKSQGVKKRRRHGVTTPKGM